MTVFHRAKIGSTTVASAYTAGSGSLAVVDGSQFGSTFPIVVIVSRAGVRMSVLEVTARATNTLTIAGAVDGTTDVNLLVGDIVKEGPTALQTNELQDAINALSSYDQFSNLTTPEVAITGTTALTAAAFGKLHVCSGTTADYTVTLPAPAGNAGRWIGLRMSPGLTRFVTIARNGSETIDGAASRLMWKSEVVTLLCDGTNWVKVHGRSIPMACNIRLSNPGNPAVAQSIPSGTYTKVLMNAVDLDNTGFMADPTNHLIKIRREGTYTVLGLISWSGLTAVGRLLCSTTKDAAALSSNEVYAAVGSFIIQGIPQNATVVLGQSIEMLALQTTGASQYIYGDPVSTSCLLQVIEVNPW